MGSIDPTTYVPDLCQGNAEDRLSHPTPPAYFGRPHGVRPGSVPLALVLGESERAAVLLTTVEAFPTGVSMIVTGLVKDPAPGIHIGDPFSEGRLRWSVDLSDGQHMTGTDPLPEKMGPDAGQPRASQPEDPEWHPDYAVLRRAGAGGGPEVFEQGYWLWPLPPAGRLRISCQWPEQGIEVTHHDLDAQPFHEAAAQAHAEHTTVQLGATTGWQTVDPDASPLPTDLRQLLESSQRSELGRVEVAVYDLARGGSAVSVGGPGANAVELIDAAIAELQEARRTFEAEELDSDTEASSRI